MARRELDLSHLGLLSRRLPRGRARHWTEPRPDSAAGSAPGSDVRPRVHRMGHLPRVDLTQAWSVVRALVLPRGVAVPPTVRETLTSQRVLWLAIGASVVLLPATFRVGRYLSTTARTLGDAARLAVVAAVAPITCMYALSSTFSPFLYFKF